MTLLFVSGEYPPDIGGVGDYTAALGSALHIRGYPSRVLSRRQVRRWDARSLIHLLRAAPPAGLIHIQFQAGAYDLLGDVCLMPALLRRVRPRVRVVTTFHDIRVPYLFPGARPLRRRAVEFLARTSHAVIAADEADLRALGAPSPRHHRVPIGSNVPCTPPAGFDRSAFRASLALGADTLGIVYFGLLNASKGIEVLLDAFDVIFNQQPDTRLLVLGGEVGASDVTDVATASAVRARLDAMGSRVLRTGWLAPTALSAHLLAADIAVLPYLDGASARRGSLLACAAHGLPIVSTRPATPDVAAAIVAVPPTPPAVAQAVLQLSAHPTQRARLRTAGRTLVETMSWPRIADQHIEIYRQLLASQA